jgi:hypothetical protein
VGEVKGVDGLGVFVLRVGFIRWALELRAGGRGAKGIEGAKLRLTLRAVAFAGGAVLEGRGLLLQP